MTQVTEHVSNEPSQGSQVILYWYAVSTEHQSLDEKQKSKHTRWLLVDFLPASCLQSVIIILCPGMILN